MGRRGLGRSIVGGAAAMGQPIGGAVPGVALLHERLTPFIAASGVLVVAGLWLTVTGRE